MRFLIHKALWPAITVALALAAIATACGGEEEAAPATATPSPSPPFPVAVSGSDGKSVTLAAAPQRIVALAPSFVEVLYAVGAGDSLVAVDQNTDFPPEAAAKTKISGFQPSVEGIADQSPDLVIITFDPGGLREALERLDIKVLNLNAPESVQGVFDQIQLLGRATGHQGEAAKLVSDMRAGIDAITAKLADLPQGPTVFHELDSTYYTAGPGSFVDDLYSTLKARNIAEAAGQPYPQMSADAIIQANPQVIVLADEDAGESPQTVAARPGWGHIAAVQDQRVYTADPDIVSRPGPRLVDALHALAELLYPDRFP